MGCIIDLVISTGERMAFLCGLHIKIAVDSLQKTCLCSEVDTTEIEAWLHRCSLETYSLIDGMIYSTLGMGHCECRPHSFGPDLSKNSPAGNVRSEILFDACFAFA